MRQSMAEKEGEADRERKRKREEEVRDKEFSGWQGHVDTWKAEIPFMHMPGGSGSAERWLNPGSVWPLKDGARKLPTPVRGLPRSSPPPQPKGIGSCSAQELDDWIHAQYKYAPYQFQHIYWCSSGAETGKCGNGWYWYLPDCLARVRFFGAAGLLSAVLKSHVQRQK